MKTKTKTIALIALVNMLTSCGTILAAVGDKITPGTGTGGSSSVTNACTLAFPTTDLCTMTQGDDKDTVLTVNATEAAMLGYINEVRTKGTLDGLTYHKIIGPDFPIFPNDDTSCSPGFAGGLTALEFEGHIHFVARKHAEYLAMNNLTSAHDKVHEEDPTLPGFRGKYLIDRHRAAGVTTTDAGGGENVYSGPNSFDPRRDAYQAMFAFMRSKVHCMAIMAPNVTYVAPGVVRKPIPDEKYGEWTSMVINTWVKK